MPVDSVRTILASYYTPITETELSKILKYMSLLISWNRKISLTTVTEPDEIIRFHFGESLFVLQTCDFSTGRLADVGSGAGFPGLAIKIFRPELDVTLIEPNLKKAAFLAEAVRALDLPSVTVISKRYTEAGINPNSLQYVTSRALSQTADLLSWSCDSLTVGGSVIFWSSDNVANQISANPLFKWKSAHIIPNTKRRVILIGHKSM